MPDFPIIDSHVHLYDPGVVGFPWMKDVPALDRPHLPSTFRASVGGVDVEALVFVEVDAAPGAHLDEANFVVGLMVEAPWIGGMVAAMPLEKGPAAVADDLAVYTKLPGARGVRRLMERHSDEPGWALQEPFVQAVRSLAAHDLSFDICVRHFQLEEATELVRRCPDVRFVLDHIGKPDIRRGETEPWMTRIAELARERNVSCKISGVVTEAEHQSWTHEEVAPYIEHAIGCFGFDRVMFGGDWPVSELATSYERWVRTVDRIVAGAAHSERRRLFRDNAIQFYRLHLG